MSQTQLSNFAGAAGVLAIILGQLGIVFPADKIAFLLMAVWTLAWQGYSFWQRYQKGDISLGGIRK